MEHQTPPLIYLDHASFPTVDHAPPLRTRLGQAAYPGVQ